MDVLAVPADRPFVDRLFGISVLAMSLPVLLCVVFAVVFASMGATYAIVLFAVPAVIMLPFVVLQCTSWAATRRIEHPVVLSPAGLLLDTPRGRISFPWEAVTGLWVFRRLFGSQLVVQLHPQAGPGSPGVVSTLTPSGWRIVRRLGMRVRLGASAPGPEELARAVDYFSRGRCRLAPVP